MPFFRVMPAASQQNGRPVTVVPGGVVEQVDTNLGNEVIIDGKKYRPLDAALVRATDVAASALGGGMPTGFTYFADPDGSRLTDADGAYLMEAA